MFICVMLEFHSLPPVSSCYYTFVYDAVFEFVIVCNKDFVFKKGDNDLVRSTL